MIITIMNLCVVLDGTLGNAGRNDTGLFIEVYRPSNWPGTDVIFSSTYEDWLQPSCPRPWVDSPRSVRSQTDGPSSKLVHRSPSLLPRSLYVTGLRALPTMEPVGEPGSHASRASPSKNLLARTRGYGLCFRPDSGGIASRQKSSPLGIHRVRMIILLHPW